MIKNGLAALLVLVCGSGCRAARSEEPEAFQGVVELDETVVAFETSGRIRRLEVDEGAWVEANAVIGVLDDELVRAVRHARALEAEAAQAEADLVRAGARREDIRALEARVRAAMASETLAQKTLERQRALFARSVVSAAAVDEVQGQHDRARAERESLEAQLAALKRGARSEERERAEARASAAKAALDLEDERLARHVLRAPIAGKVLDRHVEVGEIVAAGTPVVTLGDTRRPYVDVFVPQGSLGGIDVGDRARLRVDAEPAPFDGRVEHIARRTEFTPRFLFSERERPNLVVRVRVRVTDPRERLHAGVPALVTIQRDAGAAR